MVLEVDIAYLKQYQITAHQYLILKLIQQKKIKELEAYINATNSEVSLYGDVTGLIRKGYLKSNSTSPVDLPKLKLTDKLGRTEEIMTNPFDELYSLYPVKVVRPNGTHEYLRTDRERCKLLYAEKIGFNRKLHRNIIEALKKELKVREIRGDIAYMKKLYNWILSESWEEYLDMVGDVSANVNPDTKKYGEDIE